MKLSIIIPVKDNKEVTDLCLQSVISFTDVPYEIIIVDDGSEEETRKFLEDFASSREEVVLLRNNSTQGYVKSCNLGMKRASGEFIVLLNNDVVVSKGWASEMLKAYDIVEDLGITGPVTNYAFSAQKIEVEFPFSMERFLEEAEKIRQKNKGNIIFTPKIVGFCFLFPRSLVERIGYLDEIFSPGNFEDDDYCLRAIVSGYRNAIISSVFVWHFGSRTFTKQEIATLVEINKSKFSDKWGKIIVSDKNVWKYLPTLSLLMIVKNEERNLKELLPSIRPFMDEIVIVDTGSTDGTTKVAKRFANKVIRYKWNNSFADARNAGLKECTKEYVLWLDADDRISVPDIFNLKIFLKFSPRSGVFVTLVDKRFDGDYYSLQLRAFPNEEGIEFTGRLHEQVIPSLENKGIPLTKADICIVHHGYSDVNEIRRKLLRNLEILKEEDQNGFDANLNLARTYMGLGDNEKALYYIDRAIELSKTQKVPEDSVLLAYVSKLGILLASRIEKQELLEFLAECEKLDNSHMYLLLATSYFQLRRLDKAYFCSIKAKKTTLSPLPIRSDFFSIIFPQVKLFSSLYMGDFSLAEETAREITGIPDFTIRRFR